MTGGGSGRLSIIDISNPADPQVVAVFYAGRDNANDVYVRDGLAFVSHQRAGLVILDVGNGIAGGSPTNPVEVGRVQIDVKEPPFGFEEVNNAWYWPDGGYVFVSSSNNVWVVDVSDLSNPVEVAALRLLLSFSRVVRGGAQNFWLDEARGILYVTWWTEGLKAFDVSGELLGLLDVRAQGRLAGSILYGNTQVIRPGDALPRDDLTRSWGAQLHDGLVYVSEVTEGLWIFRPEF